MRLNVLRDAIRVSDSHLVAIARLMFIKPSVLIREAYNAKANGEYLLELLEEQKKMFEPEEEVKKKKK